MNGRREHHLNYVNEPLLQCEKLIREENVNPNDLPIHTRMEIDNLKKKPKLLTIPWKGKILMPTLNQLRECYGNLDLILENFPSRPMKSDERKYKIKFAWKGFIVIPTYQELLESKGDLNKLLEICPNKMHIVPRSNQFRPYSFSPGATTPPLGSSKVKLSNKFCHFNGGNPAVKPLQSVVGLTGVKNFNEQNTLNLETCTGESTISIVSWNVRSLNNLKKLIFPMNFTPTITCFQECWQPKNIVLRNIDSDYFLSTRKNNQGGGTFSSWKSTLTATKKIVIGDSNLIRFCVASEKTFWVANCYIGKKDKTKLQELFKEIQSNIPSPQWKYLIVVGDLNVDISNTKDNCTKTLFSICKQMGLTIQDTGPTRLDSTLDILAIGNAFKEIEFQTFQSPSDHKLLHCSFRIQKVKISDIKIKISNRKLAEKLSQEVLKKSSKAQEFLNQMIQKLKERNFDIMKTIKIKPKRNELLERILTIQNEDEDVNDIIKNY